MLFLDIGMPIRCSPPAVSLRLVRSCYLARPSHIARDGRHGLVAQRVAPEDAASKSTLVCGRSAQNLRSTDPDIPVGLRACGGNSDVPIQGWTGLPLAALNHRVAAPSSRPPLDPMA